MILIDIEAALIVTTDRYLTLSKELVELQRNLGSEVRTVRQGKGITLRDMARRIGISAVYLSDMERGNRPVSPKHLAKIKRELEIG